MFFNFSRGEQQRKASAWYYVAYEAGAMLSFGWIKDQWLSQAMGPKEVAQKEHPMLRRIGQSLVGNVSVVTIEQEAQKYHLGNDIDQGCSEDEKLGEKFLKLIDHYSACEDEQQHQAQELLTMLHRIALND